MIPCGRKKRGGDARGYSQTIFGWRLLSCLLITVLKMTVVSCTRLGLRALRACVATTIAIAPASATAGAKVSGNPEAAKLQAQNSSIAEIFEALGHVFNIHYRSSTELRDHITGNYEGSLQHVVRCILQGYNFIIKSSPGQVEVTVLGPAKKTEPPVAPTPSGPISGVTPRVPKPDAVPAADHYVE